MRATLIVIGAVTVLSSCGTTATGEGYIGKPYIQPTATEPAAEIVIFKEQAGEISLDVVNIDERGCYSGKLAIPQAKEEAGIAAGYRVHVDKKLVLHTTDPFGRKVGTHPKLVPESFTFIQKRMQSTS